jgi:hypothetical protein
MPSIGGTNHNRGITYSWTQLAGNANSTLASIAGRFEHSRRDQMVTVRAAESKRRLRLEHPQIFDALAVDEVIQSFDAMPSEAPYHRVPPRVADVWRDARSSFGAIGLATFQHVTMLTLIEQFEDRAREFRYTPAIRRRFEISFTRIIDAIENRTGSAYQEVDDLLLKDLAICRQWLFPTGAQIVEKCSAFDRSLMLRRGPKQFLTVVRTILACGGNRPFYQIHTHLNELEEFNPEGWDACYLRIAEMLRLNPEIKGMWGGSWFYDPALESVSPNLVYLRSRPEQNGAIVVYSNIDIDGGALSRSNTRRDLYNQKRYMPTAYALIWPRDALLEWAEKQAKAVG